MSSSVESYLSLIAKAFEGRLKLPAFQREWKWKTNQVILLFDSLRQGFPIGGFLFIQRTDGIDLSPREFRGADTIAAARDAELLVLDGQQRITAGLELFCGAGKTHYFIDLDKIWTLFQEREVDLADTKAIRSFLADLDAEDRYCVARRAGADPGHQLIASHRLWTAMLNDDIELERSLKGYKKNFPDREDFIDLVIGKNFRPAPQTTIPITTIDSDITVEAISRIFSTLNSTGNILTPFELVVAILFPHRVNIADDLAIAREAYPYFSKIDQTGDILLQTIALFHGRETKKAALPRTIDVEIYRLHRDDAVKYLDEAGKLLTAKMGLGLDQSSELLVYPVILSPMAYVLKILSNMNLSVEHKAQAERKLTKWFIGAVLSRRYQQSTHDKQARDKTEIVRWIEGREEDAPQWLKDTYIPNLKLADPDSALGKLLRSLVNAKAPKDPYSGKSVGVGSGRESTAKHHIFPTRFVKTLTGWDDGNDTANLALNIMFSEVTTNASWLHLDPALQVAKSREIFHADTMVLETYGVHGITAECLGIMRRPNKSRDDFNEFLAAREDFFVELLAGWGFVKPVLPPTETDEVDD